ncbi:16183_t:CDS:1 [Gigaspora rosea]|nr:16183_t:CDS:1 [Gigaspora rosea]
MYRDRLRFLMDEMANLIEKSLQQDTYIPFDPRTQAQQIIEGSLVANPKFKSRIINDDEDIFMDERETFEEALDQNIQKQNEDLIDLTDNTNMKGLYYSPFLEPNEKPIRRARSASPRLGRSETPTSPTIKITINN